MIKKKLKFMYTNQNFEILNVKNRVLNFKGATAISLTIKLATKASW